MNEEYKKLLEITDENSLIITKSHWEQRRGQDTDIYECEEQDKKDQLVATYTVKDSTSIYPPFKNSITWKKH
ncbi:hypothetical protein [Legionella feeleii]|uniref:Uncharacterized protein n=1 Tax=Legionella feeleii TaxID=453 RepID=A0A378J0B0_9GAMM|nr:hypothetical protein [Legionella feeleii]STX37714.1 Uncharacterised protein [Legionella feeleii]